MWSLAGKFGGKAGGSESRAVPIMPDRSADGQVIPPGIVAGTLRVPSAGNTAATAHGVCLLL